MTDFSYKVVDGNLRVLGTDRVERPCALPWPVAQVIQFDRTLVVRVETQPGTVFNENVFGVLEDGRIAWQVARRVLVYDDSPYMNLVRCEGKVKLMNWDGTELLADPDAGVEISVEYGK